MATATTSSRTTNYESSWISSDDCHTRNALLSQIMPYQSSPKPAQRRSIRQPQTYQKNNRGSCLKNVIRRQTCTHPWLSEDESSEDTQRFLSSQWNTTTYHFGERSTISLLTQNTDSDNMSNGVQRLSSSSATLDLSLLPERSDEPPSDPTDAAVSFAELPVYMVAEPCMSNAVSNLPVSPPDLNCHMLVDTNRKSFTVNVRLDYEDNCDGDSRSYNDRLKMPYDCKASAKAVLILYDVRALSMPIGKCSAATLQMANQLIRHAREFKMPDEQALLCSHCGKLPVLPVTGQCGHTHCTGCIEDYKACPCGAPAPKHFHVNTLIQDLIKKMLPNRISHRPEDPHFGDIHMMCARKSLRLSQVRTGRATANGVAHGARTGRATANGVAHGAHTRRWPGHPSTDISPCAPLSPESRLSHARRLVSAGQLKEAALQLVRVAVSSSPLARLARLLLAQSLSSAAASEGGDVRRLGRELLRGVRSQSARAWLSTTDLECVLCYHVYTRPVTTPCGHTYCRTCIERSMDYRKCCALCQRPLHDFNLSVSGETAFVSAALASIDALKAPLPPDPDVIPIFVCTVAYPTIPCPLFIFDPRYWMMIRRVLESGSRQFGMVAYERDRTYSDYGTVLEVKDCVHLEDGRSILSTVGVSRFRVIKRDIRDGCDVARIQPLRDLPPTEEFMIWDLRIMVTQIWYKAVVWLDGMGSGVRSEIESAFGRLPAFDHEDPEWWVTDDGPAWLWWLIAILPLRSEIKILILSTQSLMKRVMAVSRTLEALDQENTTAASSTDCEHHSDLNNADDWLERGA